MFSSLGANFLSRMRSTRKNLKMLGALQMYLVLVWLAACVTLVSPAKVLLVPINVNSHVQYFGRLASGLADHGHVTSMLVANTVKIPSWLDKKVEVLTYKVDEPVPFANSERANELMVKIATAEGFMEKLPFMKELGDEYAIHWNRDCEQVMDNAALLKQIGQSGYDLAIMDLSFLYCMYNLPYKLGIPYAHFAVPFSAWLYRVPNMPSFVPNQGSESSDRMSFFERLGNAFMESLTYIFVNDSTAYVEKYVPGKPPMTPSDFIKGGVLFFFLRDLSVYYPAPSMPNTIDIGDIMARPAEPLTGSIKTIMDKSKGAILVSFGSLLDHMPKHLSKRFCTVFRSLDLDVFWKMKNPPDCDLTSNIHIMEWVPQNDLLAHKNLQLFITHGGLNSIIESVYHGVPMIVMPIAHDQPFNAAVVHNKGMGLKMHLATFDPEELEQNIRKIVGNETIAANVKLHSAILRDKPDTAAERASFWVDHVTKYGGDHLRSAAFELSVAQFFMLDIFLFLVVMCTALLIVLFCCLRLCCKCLRRCCRKGGKPKEKVN